MAMIDHVWNKARQNPKRIVLPEGEEPRTVQAAAKVRDERLAIPVLLGNPDMISSAAKSTGTDISGIIYPVYVQNLADLDALGGCLGFDTIVHNYDKKSYIIFDDIRIEPRTQEIYDDNIQGIR